MKVKRVTNVILIKNNQISNVIVKKKNPTRKSGKRK